MPWVTSVASRFVLERPHCRSRCTQGSRETDESTLRPERRETFVLPSFDLAAAERNPSSLYAVQLFNCSLAVRLTSSFAPPLLDRFLASRNYPIERSMEDSQRQPVQKQIDENEEYQTSIRSRELEEFRRFVSLQSLTMKYDCNNHDDLMYRYCVENLCQTVDGRR